MTARSVTRVRGPDGTNRWYAVECHGSKGNCYDAAAETCPDGYTIADSSGGATMSASFSGYQGDMLIQCKSDAPSERGSSAVQREEAQESALASRVADDKDYSTCNNVYEHIEDTVDLWTEWFHGSPPDKMPSRPAFNEACVDLDESVQLCLAPAYAKLHRDACLAAIDGLPKGTRRRLDELLSK